MSHGKNQETMKTEGNRNCPWEWPDVDLTEKEFKVANINMFTELKERKAWLKKQRKVWQECYVIQKYQERDRNYFEKETSGNSGVV